MKAIHSLALASALTLATTACSGKKEPAPKPVTTSMAAIAVSPEYRLVNAVQNFDKLEAEERLTLVSKLLEDGASPDAENEFGEPVLADAVHFGNGEFDDIRIVRLLIEKGAEVNKVGATGRSPLTKAAESNNSEAIQLMLAHGLVVNNENGTRAMVKAAYLGHKQIVQLLLSNGLKPHGKYERALLEMSQEENSAVAALFGAYTDIAKEELNALLGKNSRSTNDSFLTLQLGKITQACTSINKGASYSENMSDFFNRSEECTSMGRLGSLAYMHCYGLLQGNTASLRNLQASINGAAGEARAVMTWQNVNFKEITSSEKLLSYDKAIRRAMALYQDMVLPWTRATVGKMNHHQKRNRELRGQADKCGNKEIQHGANEIGASVGNIVSNQSQQVNSFRQELAAMEKMRSQIAYQLPALGANEELKRREEEKKRQEEEKKKQEEEKKDEQPAPRA